MAFALRLLLCAALLARAASVRSQDTGTWHDAPYSPSPPSTVDEMLRLGAVSVSDVVYDLGSGDGRVVIAAARKFGARGVGSAQRIESWRAEKKQGRTWTYPILRGA